MTNTDTMTRGLPKTYWRFRGLVSTVQLTAILALFTATTVWMISDDNGIQLWNNYYAFSQSMWEWTVTNLRFPWGG